jgi:hypothetical protein
MRKRNELFMLLAGLGAASSLALASCADYTDGQDKEPEGALKVLRMTLFDGHRAHPVFTDTSSPSDCKDPGQAQLNRCVNDPFGDQFGVKKSPPTPDSAQDLRVVFNKLPLLLNGMDIQKITKEEMRPPTKIELAAFAKDVMQLKCSGCTAVPPYSVDVQLTGSELSPDPTVFPYGPSLQIVTDSEDPLASLEPETSYSVEIAAGLSGRDGAKIEVDSESQKLLRFTTEAFQVLVAGIGDPDSDADVTGQSGPYEVEGLATNGAIAVALNASVDPSVFQSLTATATVGGTDVPVRIGVNQITTDMMTMMDVCDPGNQRTLYVYPVAGTWGAMVAEGDEVTVTIKGADIRDVSQAENHPAGQGKHTLKADIVVKAVLSGKAADDNYTGLTVGTVAADVDCPGTMTEDMSSGADMASTGDMTNQG